MTKFSVVGSAVLSTVVGMSDGLKSSDVWSSVIVTKFPVVGYSVVSASKDVGLSVRLESSNIGSSSKLEASFVDSFGMSKKL